MLHHHVSAVAQNVPTNTGSREGLDVSIHSPTGVIGEGLMEGHSHLIPVRLVSRRTGSRQGGGDELNVKGIRRTLRMNAAVIVVALMAPCYIRLYPRSCDLYAERVDHSAAVNPGYRAPPYSR
ncbi:unnamed protein product [Pleuronectes platessa]|uniref:Uncharacterized protein n=1 Tax=Pleuronectes platessa TaxID=8262 RepID=A0A9N7UEI9_PLEPL|nr:unnamed protein product [Pleuronectes platessa]